MQQEHVIDGFLRKRQIVADELEAKRNKLRQIAQDIDAVDSTIRLFQPSCEIGIVRILTTPCRDPGARAAVGS